MVPVTNLLKGQSVDRSSSHVRIDINQIFIQRHTELFVFLLLSEVFEIIVTAVSHIKNFLRFFNFVVGKFANCACFDFNSSHFAKYYSLAESTYTKHKF